MWDMGELVAMSTFILELSTLVNLKIRNNHGDIKGLRAQGYPENVWVCGWGKAYPL